MIESVEIEGVEYPIISESEKIGKINTMRFKTIINGEEYKLEAKYSSEMVNDLRVICGLNAEEELRNILTHELKHEIYRIILNLKLLEF